MKIPPPEDDSICFCPLTGLLDVLAKKWALLIIALLGNEGEKGFNELKNELGSISPNPSLIP
jgi:DNA-binding HxlR family transcriptional regulator